MKKVFVGMLAVLCMVFSAQVFAKPVGDPLYIVKDGETLEIEGMQVGSTKMLPLRDMVDLLGGRLEWDAEDQHIVIFTNREIYAHILGTSSVWMNPGGHRQEPIDMESESILYEGRTYVPSTFFTGITDYPIYWDDELGKFVIGNKWIIVKANYTVLDRETVRGTFKDGIMFLPVKPVLEALEWDVSWDPEEQEISMHLEGRAVWQRAGETSTVVVGGYESKLLTAPSYINEDGQLMASLDLFTEIIGAEAEWDEDLYSINLEF